jgi:hypothetical protein
MQADRAEKRKEVFKKSIIIRKLKNEAESRWKALKQEKINEKRSRCSNDTDIALNSDSLALLAEVSF